MEPVFFESWSCLIECASESDAVGVVEDPADDDVPEGGAAADVESVLDGEQELIVWRLRVATERPCKTPAQGDTKGFTSTGKVTCLTERVV